MRLLLCSTIVAAITASVTVLSQRDQPQPTFRSRVDLLTLDVAVLNRDGAPIEDLRPDDFVVRIGGETRRVVSARLVKAERTGVTTPSPYFSTNSTADAGRKVMFAVDQLRLTPGTIAPLLDAAKAFLDGLAPADAAALTLIPPIGQGVPFTTNKARVRDALRMELGTPGTDVGARVNLSLGEAIRIADTELSTGPGEAGPVTQQVLDREGCEGDAAACIREIKNAALQTAQQARTEGRISLAQLESLLDQLALIDGPKTLVLVSPGMFTDDANEVRDLVRRATRARTTIHVVTVEQRLVAGDAGNPRRAVGSLADRQLELEGLQEAAAGTGGGFYRPLGDGAEVFARIASEISASYVLGVELQPDDRTRDRVTVDVRRRGVTLRASTALAAALAPAASRPASERLSDLLSSPVAVAGVPLRVATFLSRDSATGRTRLTLAAEIGQAGAPAGEYGVGYVLTDPAGKVAGRGGTMQTLTATPAAPARYDGALVLDPGAYTLRFGVVDPEGRRGSVVQDVVIGPPAPPAVDISDLLVGSVAGNATIGPAVEPHIRVGEVGLYLELYPPAGDTGDWSVTFEVGEGVQSPSLATARAAMGSGARAPWLTAGATIDTRLAPGRYVARARVRRNGTTVAMAARPIVIEPNPSLPPDVPPSSPAGHPELARRTAAYVSGFVLGLSNVVAQEDFSLPRGRRVRSDFLLVRYPGSEGDLLAFRDVYHVNGNDRPGREERLAGLFVKPYDSIRDRAREIQLDGEDFVPPIFNPLFAISFLQGHYQNRFRFTVADARAPWADGVREVSFVETGRPSLLRGGWNGGVDVPSRGTAWIEEATGRVLRTELLIGEVSARTPAIVTNFALDPRLQIMVPTDIQTKNPDGQAVYSNYRRFTVSAETTIK